MVRADGGADEDDVARLDRLARGDTVLRERVMQDARTPVVGEDSILAGFRVQMEAQQRRRRIPWGWLLGAAAAALVFGFLVNPWMRSWVADGDGGGRHDRYLGEQRFALRDQGAFGAVQLSARDFSPDEGRLELIVRALDAHDQPGIELWRSEDASPGPIEVPVAALAGVARIEFQLTIYRLGSSLPQYVTHRQSR
ncbi:MAG: hypothetical protein AB7I19_10005 [Planctomycetota bacterium]